MSEKDLSRLLMTRMSLNGHFVRIENMVGVGIPDVSYCLRGVEGFIENKWRSGWPARPDDPVTLDHFTPVQRNWIRRRRDAGGRVYVLLEVERPVCSYFLLPGGWAAQHLGFVPRRTIECAAIVTGLRRFPVEGLNKVLGDAQLR